MTFAEIRDEIDAYNWRKETTIKEREQTQAVTDYQLAQLIGYMVHDPKKYPRTIDKAYPGLFERKKQDWRESKANFARFAEEHNRQRGGGTA